jgi:hypothetical protein
MKFNLLLVTLLVLSSNLAHAGQIITCKFSDGSNSDRVVVALSSDQAGTLAYSTGPQDVSTSSADGVLTLKRTTDPSADTAGFSTSVEVMQMSFKMPKAQVLKAGVSFKASLHTSIDAMGTSQDQDLSCAAI